MLDNYTGIQNLTFFLHIRQKLPILPNFGPSNPKLGFLDHVGNLQYCRFHNWQGRKLDFIGRYSKKDK